MSVLVGAHQEFGKNDRSLTVQWKTLCNALHERGKTLAIAQSLLPQVHRALRVARPLFENCEMDLFWVSFLDVLQAFGAMRETRLQ